jgi:hypothetical protein
MRFRAATRWVTSAWRWAISARHSRTRFCGTTTVGSCPSASSWARRRASSRSVFRFACLYFHASAAVLATLTGTPSSAHRSWTHPARVHASITTTAGLVPRMSRSTSAREVVRVRNSAAAVARS